MADALRTLPPFGHEASLRGSCLPIRLLNYVLKHYGTDTIKTHQNLKFQNKCVDFKIGLISLKTQRISAIYGSKSRRECRQTISKENLFIKQNSVALWLIKRLKFFFRTPDDTSVELFHWQFGNICFCSLTRKRVCSFCRVS